MPQPLPHNQEVFVISGFPLMVSDDQLRVLATAQIAISTWAAIEAQQLHTFTLLLGGNTSLASAAYLALESASAKKSVLQAAARKALEPSVYKLFNRLLKLTDRHAKFRHKLAHWQLVATNPSFPDTIVLCDPTASAKGENLHDNCRRFKADEIKSFTATALSIGGLYADFAELIPERWPWPEAQLSQLKSSIDQHDPERIADLIAPDEWPDWLQPT